MSWFKGKKQTILPHPGSTASTWLTTYRWWAMSQSLCPELTWPQQRILASRTHNPLEQHHQAFDQPSTLSHV